MGRRPVYKSILLAVMALGLLAALLLCAQRVTREVRNSAVTFVMSREDLNTLSAAWGGTAETCAAQMGVRILEPWETACIDGAVILTEDAAQHSYDPARGGSYDPSLPAVRCFRTDGDYSDRAAFLGALDTEELGNMLYRAVTERNIRLLWLTPIPGADGEDYRAMVAECTARIAAPGLHVSDSPSTLQARRPDAALLLLTALGTAAAALCLLLLTFPALDRPAPAYTALAVLAAATLGVYALARSLFIPGFAFCAAVIWPCLAAAALLHALTGPEPAWLRSLGLVLGLSLLGGMTVAALQSGDRYLLAVDNFRGVKLSQVLPLLYAAFLTFRDLCRPREILRHSRAILPLGLGILALAALLLLLRSGNWLPLISGWEWRLRNWLEHVLLTRPRTKEFLLAWPCLALAILLLRRRKPWLAWPFVILSLIAATSVVNTFCHGRAPVLLSLIRSCLGALIGLVLGTVLLLLLRKRKKDQI